MYFKYIVKIQ